MPIFSNNGKSFMTLRSFVKGRDVWLGTRANIHFGEKNSKILTPVTLEDYTVLKVLAWDTANHYV